MKKLLILMLALMVVGAGSVYAIDGNIGSSILERHIEQEQLK